MGNQNSGKENSILRLPKDRAPDETDGVLFGDILSHLPSAVAPVQRAGHVPQLAARGPGLRSLRPMDVTRGEVTV